MNRKKQDRNSRYFDTLWLSRGVWSFDDILILWPPAKPKFYLKVCTQLLRNYQLGEKSSTITEVGAICRELWGVSRLWAVLFSSSPPLSIYHSFFLSSGHIVDLSLALYEQVKGAPRPRIADAHGYRAPLSVCVVVVDCVVVEFSLIFISGCKGGCRRRFFVKLHSWK